MTAPTDERERGQVTTRGLLKGLGGILVGAGLGAGGVYALAERTDAVDSRELFGRWLPRERPPPSEPASTVGPRTTPWDTTTLTVAIERDPSVVGFDAALEQLAVAVSFWNDYVASNEPFDLTLSFEPDGADPDVLFVEHSLMDCVGQYETPATNDPDLTEQVCVSTLTEPPEETPVTADVGTGLGGTAYYGLVVRHALGRMIGYDVWTGPVGVMTPEILVGPAHADHPDATFLLGEPSHRYEEFLRFLDSMAEHDLPDLREPEPGQVRPALGSVREDLQELLAEHESAMRTWASDAERWGYPAYPRAYDATVRSEEIAFLEETSTLLEEVLATDSSESMAGSDALEAVVSRLETMLAWPGTREAWDVQVHRDFAAAVWAEWAGD